MAALVELDTGNVLSSDAKVSYGISAENAYFQPRKRWYGFQQCGQLNPFDQQAACLPPKPVNNLLALASDHLQARLLLFWTVESTPITQHLQAEYLEKANHLLVTLILTIH